MLTRHLELADTNQALDQFVVTVLLLHAGPSSHVECPT